MKLAHEMKKGEKRETHTNERDKHFKLPTQESTI